MENKIQFWLDMKPQPQERIRLHIRGRGKYMKVFPYLPEATRDYQNGIRRQVRELMETNGWSEFPKDGPLYMEAIFYLHRPASAKKRVAPTVRPDLTNYLKAVEDGIQRATKDDIAPSLVEDDSSICAIYTEKRYCDETWPAPGILVTISNWCPL